VVVIWAAAAGAAVFLLTRDDGGRPTVELSAEEQEYADAIGQSGTADSGLDAGMGDCAGTAVVQVVGIEALRSEVTPDELRYTTAESLRDLGVAPLEESKVAELARRLDECGDWEEAWMDELTTVEGATSEELACVRDNLTEEIITYASAAAYAGSAALTATANQSLTDVLEPCRGLGESGLGG
jgi:hypothetical protein